MLDRIYGQIAFECDACGEALETGEKEFAEAKAFFDAEDWRALKVGSDWVHTCPGCKDKGQRDERARRAGRIP